MPTMHQAYDLAIFQLTIYALLTPFALFVFIQVARRTPIHTPGWFYLLGFLSLLLAASGLTVGAGEDSTSSTGLVLSAVGLSPLFVCIESVIREAVSETEIARIKKTPFFRPLGGIVLHFIVVIPAVLTGVGANALLSSSSSPKDVMDGRRLVRAGVVVFVVPWLWLVFMVAMAMKEWRSTISSSSSTKKFLLVACIVSIPLLAVRILYGILEFFVTSTIVFDPIRGNVVARLFLSVLPLMTVAVAITVAGVLANLTRREGSIDTGEPRT